MNYKNIRLDKDILKCGLSLSSVLEQIDPSNTYIGTGLDSLDAFERQLKRFDIKVSGDNADVVSKFFYTDETAILFPEFVIRLLEKEMSNSMLSSFYLTKTRINSLDYRSVHFGGKNKSALVLNDELTKLKKTEFLITNNFEAIKYIKTNVFTEAIKFKAKEIINNIVDHIICLNEDGNVEFVTGGWDLSDDMKSASLIYGINNLEL